MRVQGEAIRTVETDVATFERYLETATESNGIEHLVEAAVLYRGELLQGFALAGSPAFEDWLRRKREYYRHQAIDALNRLIRHYRGLTDYEQACHYARRLVSLAPWREEAHRHLMELLARTGQRSVALKQYDECRRHLREKLDAEPALATDRLRRRIQQMAFARFELPPPQTPFIGREKELSTLIAYLSDPECRLITITGLGGMGKSRLALQAGRRAANERARMFLHGVAFVPLVGADTPEHVVAAIAQALEFTFSGGETPHTQLLGYLQEKEVLLILDSFEHLIGDRSAVLLSTILESAPDVTLLVTSRARLHMRSEYLLPLGGLHVPDVDEASRMPAQPDVEQGGAPHLFADAMKRMQPDLVLTEADVRGIIDICRMLDGMPLAIELAAAWTDTLSLTEIGVRVQQSLDFLRRDRPDTPARHRSVRAVLDGSWRRLSTDEQRVMAELSILRGGFTRQAAESVTGVSLPLLSRLVSYSFVHYDRARGRYQIHELLRQYSAEKLVTQSAESSSATEVANVRSRHSDYYCVRMQSLEANLWSTREEDALDEIDADFENIRSAWHWAADRGNVTQLDQAARVLHQYLSRRGLYEEGAAMFQAAIRAVRRWLWTHLRELLGCFVAPQRPIKQDGSPIGAPDEVRYRHTRRRPLSPG